MKREIGLASVVLATLAAAAEAATLYAGPVNLSSGSAELQCLVQNVSKDRRHVQVAAIAFDGTVEVSDEFDLDPLEATKIDATSALLCRFEVKGGKNTIRATACVFPTGGVGCIATEAAR